MSQINYLDTRLNDEQGAVMLEALLSIGLYLAIILFGCDLMRLGFNVISSQYVASKTMREMILGGPQSATDRADLLEDKLIASAADLGINLGPAAGNNPFVTVCSVAGGDCSGGDHAGEEEQLVSIRIRYPVSLFFGLVAYPVDIVVLGRNEPFRSL